LDFFFAAICFILYFVSVVSQTDKMSKINNVADKARAAFVIIMANFSS
jgi:hypothetical protein